MEAIGRGTFWFFILRFLNLLSKTRDFHAMRLWKMVLGSLISLFSSHLSLEFFHVILLGLLLLSCNPFVFSQYMSVVTGTRIDFPVNQNLPLSLPHLQDYFHDFQRLWLSCHCCHLTMSNEHVTSNV